ncbi:RNA 2',3'-cyclic phosphodiesterase [Tatumella saanichensis]|uniref:RNA 2',3'-cyclic phosphodiesterase n=1 Tax=Tatumella saanichensis TaxID=480813 RepID=UPI0004A4CC17|nr:RNA 2',3'-cyclic phosphodiesterase [Tatumella saanichensis]
MAGPYFYFALNLPPRLQRQLVHWRAEHFPADYGKPIPSAGMNITLAWLGEISEATCQRLQHQASRIRQPAFTLTLNDAGHWPASGYLWLGCRPAPTGVLQLAALLRSQAARLGCPQPARPFHPHVRLIHQAYRAVTLPPAGFQWQTRISEFSLMCGGGANRKRPHAIATFPLINELPPDEE